MEWHGELPSANDTYAHYGSIQEKLTGDLETLLRQWPAYSAIYAANMADQLVTLLCKVAALGYIAKDVKPMNVGVAIEQDAVSGTLSPPRLTLLDFDPQFFVPSSLSPAANLHAMKHLLVNHLRLTATVTFQGARALIAALRKVSEPSRLRRQSVTGAIHSTSRESQHYFHNPNPHCYTEAKPEQGEAVGDVDFSAGTPPRCQTTEAEGAAIHAASLS